LEGKLIRIKEVVSLAVSRVFNAEKQLWRDGVGKVQKLRMEDAKNEVVEQSQLLNQLGLLPTRPRFFFLPGRLCVFFSETNYYKLMSGNYYWGFYQM
jgi:hypothetical protein